MQLDTTELTVDEVVKRIAQTRRGGEPVNRERVWAIGRLTIQPPVVVLTRLRVYGVERVPLEGGIVIAANHFSWIDPPALGAASPRPVYYMAKVEAHRVPGLGQLMRSFGAFPVRRGESDREAVRDDARDRQRRGMRSGCSSRGRGRRAACPARRSRAPRWSR